MRVERKRTLYQKQNKEDFRANPNPNPSSLDTLFHRGLTQTSTKSLTTDVIRMAQMAQRERERERERERGRERERERKEAQKVPQKSPSRAHECIGSRTSRTEPV